MGHYTMLREASHSVQRSFRHKASHIEFLQTFSFIADRDVPTLVTSLRTKGVRYVACGEEHTAVLTKVCYTILLSLTLDLSS